MGLLDEALAYIDNKKRVVGKNVQGLLNAPADTLSQWQAQTKEDIAPTTQALMGWKPGDAQSTQAAVQAMAPLGLLGATTKIHEYAPIYRPANATNMPAGIKNISGPTGEHKFGTVAYDRPLTKAELDSFELRPTDPNHPVNLQKSWEGFHEKFLNEFSEKGSYEVKNGTHHAIVTESARPEAPFQVTSFSKGQPSGHEAFSDFDDLSKYVWGMTRVKARTTPEAE